MNLTEILDQAGGAYMIDASNQFKVANVRRKINCTCGRMVALEGDGVTMLRSNVALIDHGRNRMLVRCADCKRITVLEKDKKRLTI